MMSNGGIGKKRSSSDVTYTTIQIGNCSFVLDSRYQDLHLQGNGSYGTVVSAFDSYLCRKVAIKKVIDPFQDIVSVLYFL